ncbi:hypothetical protein VTI74DRAFT_4088 [Chaetomium olivicolor]
MSIQPLPGDVVARIKSSAVITSLNGAVCGLLQNSLDAGASKVNVSVDYSRGNCSVEDNGLGIPPAAFREDGGLGKLHYTSKYPPRAGCHGKHGEFLASLAALSLLSITSHHHDYRSHNSLTIHNSRVVARNLPAPPEQRVLAFVSGTRVAVRDLFGAMPVRVKQRAIEVERAGTSRDFEQLIFNLVALLLPWPGEVAVSLQDSYARRSLSLSASGVVDWSRSYRTTAPDIISRTTALLTQASLVDNVDPNSWVPIGATASSMSVRGCVSVQPVATKRVQFIALGIQPLLNEHHSNFLYEEINRVFEDSSFGVVEEATVGDDGLPAKTTGFTGRELKPKRGIDRWPMFFIQIVLDTGTGLVDIDEFLDDRLQNLTIITDLLQVMLYEFLKKHHFRPRCVNALERLKQPRSHSPALPSQSPRESAPSPATGQTKPEAERSRSKRSGTGRSIVPYLVKEPSEQRSASPFASWSKVKPNIPTSAREKDTAASGRSVPRPLGEPIIGWNPATDTTSKRQKPLFDKSGNLVRKPFDDMNEAPAACATERLAKEAERTNIHPATESEIGRETVVWVDPATKIKSLIDPRTGFAVKARTNTTRVVDPRLALGKRAADVPRLQQFVRAPRERNIVFRHTEAPIPRVQVSEMQKCHHVICNGPGREDLEGLTTEASSGGMRTTLEGRISKAALRAAEVVSQVDHKFILAKVATVLPTGSASRVTEADRMLILIDQHAADERCKVEGLLSAYFIPDPDGSGNLVVQTQGLDKPLRFELSRQDGELLVRFQQHFAHWGIICQVIRDGQAPTHKEVTVEVRELPPSILERCRLEPRVLIDLLRKEIWKLHGTGGRFSNPTVRPDWVARFYDCPEGILDLISSRACRSAIMFNDVLTPEQCRHLVQRLAACTFPFQCAHGRPSMVPLVHLGQNSALGLGDREPGGEIAGELTHDLRRWKRSVGC